MEKRSLIARKACKKYQANLTGGLLDVPEPWSVNSDATESMYHRDAESYRAAYKEYRVVAG